MSNDPQGRQSEYLRAFRTTRRFKNLLVLLLLLAIGGQIAAYVMVDFAGMLGPVAGDRTDAASPEADRARAVRDGLEVGLQAAKFVAFAAAALLALTLTFAAKISLVDRLGGVAGFVGAFFWSLVALALVVPWQDFWHGPVVGAMSALSAVEAGAASLRPPGEPGAALHVRLLIYGRFLFLPGVALLTVLVTAWRFARGYADLGAVNRETAS